MEHLKEYIQAQKDYEKYCKIYNEQPERDKHSRIDPSTQHYFDIKERYDKEFIEKNFFLWDSQGEQQLN